MRLFNFIPQLFLFEAVVEGASGGGGGESANPPPEIDENSIDAMIARAIEPAIAGIIKTMEEKFKGITFVTPSQAEEDKKQKGGFANIGEFTQGVMAFFNGDRSDERCKALLETRIGEDGGLLVPPEFSNMLFKAAEETSILWKRITRIPINGNSVLLPAISDYTHASDTYYGGIVNYWGEEGFTGTETTPKFDSIQLRLKDNMTLIPISNDLLQDSPVSIGPLVMTLASNALGMAMDNVIINGDGAGKPKGLLNSNCSIQVSKETGQDAATINATNIMKMFARFNKRYLRDAIWLGNDTILPQLMQMNLTMGTAGTPLWMAPNGLAGTPMGQLIGKELLYTEFCKALGTVGDLVLCAPSQYLAIDKAAQSTWSREVYFTSNKSLLRLIYRVDGQMWQIKAFTPANGDTLSPVVKLQTRS